MVLRLASAFVAAFLIGHVQADVYPQEKDVSGLPETVPSDIVFWQLENQYWDESDSRLCIYDPAVQICKMNIGWVVKAAGLSKEIIETPDWNYMLRFRMNDACYSAVVATESGGQKCAEWDEDWSRYPLAAPHKINISSICYSVVDDMGSELGCAHSAPWGMEPLTDFQRFKQCDIDYPPLPDTDQNPPLLKCRHDSFDIATGRNYSVLYGMYDIIMQTGGKCQVYYSEKPPTVRADPELAVSWCEWENNTMSAVNDALNEFRNTKNFYGTFKNPLSPDAVFAPPPPPSPPAPFPPPAPPLSPPLTVRLSPQGGGGILTDGKNPSVFNELGAGSMTTAHMLVALLAVLAAAALLQ